MNKANFIDRIGVFIRASVPVTVVKTREPFGAVEAISDCVNVMNQSIDHKNQISDPSERKELLAFGSWNMYGWTIKNAERFDGEFRNVDALDALEADESTNTVYNGLEHLIKLQGEKEIAPDGVYVMMWPHFLFQEPVIKLLLLEVAHKFNSRRKRLVLVVPENVEIPNELQDFVSITQYEVPSEEERIGIIETIYEAYDLPIDQAGLKMLSSMGGGMTSFELTNGLSRTITEALKKSDEAELEVVADQLSKQKTELVHRTGVLEIIPVGDIADVGGLELVKEWFYKRKECFTDRARSFGVSPIGGVGLVGNPGTGKTLLAMAVASVLGVQLIKFNASAVFNKMVGGTEERVSNALNTLKSIGNSVVLLDEVDKIFNTNTGQGDSGVSSRFLNQLLTFMSDNKGIVWIFTFNRAEGLPPELLRPGRLDAIFSVTSPNAEDRDSIIRIHLRKRNQNNTIDLTKSVAASEGYTGAELESAVKDAVLEAYFAGSDVDDDLIRDSLPKKPLSQMYPEQVRAMEEWAEKNARPASKPAKTLNSSSKPKSSSKKIEMI